MSMRPCAPSTARFRWTVRAGMNHRQEEDAGGVWRRDGRLHTVVCPPAADVDTGRSGGGGAGAAPTRRGPHAPEWPFP